MEELKPCPFCGGEAKLIKGYPNQQSGNRYFRFVRCENCGAKAKTYSRFAFESINSVDKMAIDAWNRRAK